MASGRCEEVFVGRYIAFGVTFGHMDNLTTSYRHANI